MSTDKKNRLTPLLLPFAVGAIAGWLSSQYWSGGSNEPEPEIAVQQTVGESSILPDGPTTDATVQPENDNEASANTNTQINDQANIEARLAQLITEDIEVFDLTADRIIDYLHHILQDPGRRILGEKELRALIRDNPEINYALLDKFMNIEDDHVRNQLGLVFMINNGSQRPFLEPKVMEKIKLGEHRSEWLEVIGQWGLQAKSNIAYLLDEIPYFDNPADVGSSIRAIAGSSWAESSALSPSEQSYVSETVRRYHASENASVRAASVAALRTFPSEDIEQRLIDALQDTEALVRNEAMQVYQNNPFPSAEIEALIKPDQGEQ